MLTPMKSFIAVLCLVALQPASAPNRVMTTAGPIEGAAEGNGIRAFKGIPFAEPPVGPLRWQPPQPLKKWSAPRQATAFGAQCMQRHDFADMVFRSSGTSEDCLYLNV